MEEPLLIGPIAGGIIGYILSFIVVSPRFRHVGRGRFSKEGGMGFFKGCLISLIFMAVGAGIGYVIASSMS
ncbi:MAG: hypothetical protein HQ565_09180 [Bacteroidetes bacterium]|nr:hypothetical protein [Bacteroidota bacterium]